MDQHIKSDFIKNAAWCICENRRLLNFFLRSFLLTIATMLYEFLNLGFQITPDVVLLNKMILCDTLMSTDMQLVIFMDNIIVILSSTGGVKAVCNGTVSTRGGGGCPVTCSNNKRDSSITRFSMHSIDFQDVKSNLLVFRILIVRNFNSLITSRRKKSIHNNCFVYLNIKSFFYRKYYDITFKANWINNANFSEHKLINIWLSISRLYKIPERHCGKIVYIYLLSLL